MAKILIVDDEQMIRSTLGGYLEDEGYEVVLVESGEEALDVLASQEIDLAIVDVRLPGIEGTEVVLQGMKNKPLIKYFLHTGSSEFEISAELQALGFSSDNVILKPILDMGILMQTIEKVLKG